jgi:phospholipase C
MKMHAVDFGACLRRGKHCLAMLLALWIVGVPSYVRAQSPVTPIQHVIVIIGENRSFDHVFATYVPKAGQTVSNLLSKGIVNANGSPGPNYSLTSQDAALDTTTYSINPGGKTGYNPIPAPGTGGAPTVASDTSPAPFLTMAVAELAEPDLFGKYYYYLLTGATGLPNDVVDTRIARVNDLGTGSFHLTPSISYDAYAASPVHRFYQMWQQEDCSKATISSSNPSGCLADLFPWVEVSVGAGTNGDPQPQPFTNITTGEGSTSMAFYNVQNGDAPYLKSLADTYTLSDNMHQSVMGGTGANHIMFGYADAIWYSDGNGNAASRPDRKSQSHARHE